MKTSGPSYRNAEMFILGGAVGFLVELIFRGERKCPACAPCNAGLTIVPKQVVVQAPNASQVPR